MSYAVSIVANFRELWYADENKGGKTWKRILPKL
jgi:hypothetical protein